MDFRTELKKVLLERNMTIKQLSEISGISINTLYSATKRDSASYEIINRLEEVLKVKFDKKCIGKRIKISRKNAGLTQEELARKIGKTESSIRKYEKGLTQIPFDVLESVAQALNVSPYDLIGYPDLSNVPTDVLLAELKRRCDYGSGKEL